MCHVNSCQLLRSLDSGTGRAVKMPRSWPGQKLRRTTTQRWMPWREWISPSQRVRMTSLLSAPVRGVVACLPAMTHRLNPRRPTFSHRFHSLFLAFQPHLHQTPMYNQLDVLDWGW